MTNKDLSFSAKIARKILKIVLIPMILLGVFLRFTAPSWADAAFLILLAVVFILAVVGRVFKSVK